MYIYILYIFNDGVYSEYNATFEEDIFFKKYY